MPNKANIFALPLSLIIIAVNRKGFSDLHLFRFPVLVCFCLALFLSPHRVGAADGDLVVYSDDSLLSGWQNWSWNTTADLSSPAYSHTGSSSIKVTYTAPWAGFRLNHDAFCDSSYTHLSFWINGGAQGGRTISVRGLINNVEQSAIALDNYIEGGAIAAATWRKVSIPLANLGVANTCDMTGFWLQEAGGSAQAPFYVDDIALLASPPPAIVNLSVNANHLVRVVDDRLFGVNTAVWDGALNTPETITLLQAIDNKILRFPGGSAADAYHWQTNTSDGNNWQWATNFDAFANVARSTGAQAFITVNYGSGTPQEAADWVRYANITKKYGFKYWEIGNENYGSWENDLQVRPHDPFRYAQRTKDYMAQMKAIDPTIKLGVVLIEGEDAYANYTDHPATNPRTGVAHNGWTPVLLSTLKSLSIVPDFVIYHRYEQEPGNEGDAFLLQAAKGWKTVAAGLRQQLSDYLGAASVNVEIVATENNSVSYNPGKQTTSLVNGLYLADSLGTIMQTEFKALAWWDLRNSQESANNNSGILYGWRQYGDYGIMSAMNDLYPTYSAIAVVAGVARGGDQIITAGSDYDLLSVYAAKRSNGKLSLLVINKSPSVRLTASIQLIGFTPQANATLISYGIPQDEAARTGAGNPNPESAVFSGAATTFTRAFAPYSVTVISLANGAIPVDTDGDGIADLEDNCTLVANANQRDTDQDGYGNFCDADLNNDLIVNTIDLGLFKKCYLKQSADAQCQSPPDADINGDGIANVIDLGLFKKMYLNPPGPRGLLE
jgi:alpha-N-arabinofuranosidase